MQKQCHDRATCITELETIFCICADGYKGLDCQQCHDLECRNNGICRKLKNGISICECKNGYTGTNCDIKKCEGYCNGNGNCTMKIGGAAHCDCEPGINLIIFYFILIVYYLIL